MLEQNLLIWYFHYSTKSKGENHIRKQQIFVFVYENAHAWWKMEHYKRVVPIKLTCIIRRVVAAQIWPLVQKQPNMVHSTAAQAMDNRSANVFIGIFLTQEINLRYNKCFHLQLVQEEMRLKMQVETGSPWIYSYIWDGTDLYQGQHPQKQQLGFFLQALVKQAAKNKKKIRHSRRKQRVSKQQKLPIESLLWVLFSTLAIKAGRLSKLCNVHSLLTMLV